MGKKRDRRVTPSSKKGGEQRVELGDSAESNRRLAIIFVLFFVVSPAISVLVYRIKYATTTNPTDSYVFQRGLVRADVDFQEILAVSTTVLSNVWFVRKLRKQTLFVLDFSDLGFELFISWIFSQQPNRFNFLVKERKF